MTESDAEPVQADEKIEKDREHAENAEENDPEQKKNEVKPDDVEK